MRFVNHSIKLSKNDFIELNRARARLFLIKNYNFFKDEQRTKIVSNDVIY